MATTKVVTTRTPIVVIAQATAPGTPKGVTRMQAMATDTAVTRPLELAMAVATDTETAATEASASTAATNEGWPVGNRQIPESPWIAADSD